MKRPPIFAAVLSSIACMLLSNLISAQAGMWTLEGWPDASDEFYAGSTTVYADGERMKVVEWRDNSRDSAHSMETYFLGFTGIKVFTWNGERVGLVFESERMLPHAQWTSSGQLVLPAPYPSAADEVADLPCGEGCVYHVRISDHASLDPSMFAPGGELESTFTPPQEVALMSPDEFFERFRIAPPEWATLR